METNALYARGEYEAAATRAEQAVRASAEAGDRTLEASAVRLLGKLALARGDVEGGVREAGRAIAIAREAEDDRTTAELALDLAYAEGVTAGRAAVGADWLKQADAAIARVDAPVRLQARRASVASALRSSAGDSATALALARTAVDTLAAYDDEDPHLLEYEANAGVAAYLSGDPHAARATMTRTLARMEARLGAGHPAAVGLAGSSAAPLLETGRYAEAEAVLAHALASSDARPFELVLNLAIAQTLRGRFVAAERHYDEALAIAERQATSAPLVAAQVLINIADFAARSGDLARARAAIARARVTIESALPPEHPVAAILLATDCLVRTRAGEYDAAIELGRRAQAIAESSGDARLLASVLVELGEAELAAHRNEAAATLARADAIAWPGHDPLLAARIRFALARASPPPHARAIAKTSEQRFPTDGDDRERRAIAAFVAAPR
jgi:tetratricopeptide (TPR) repeat protein